MIAKTSIAKDGREMQKATNYFIYSFVSHKAYHNKILAENGK